jgi:ADP-heptose:LPS heptosyltransferase
MKPPTEHSHTTVIPIVAGIGNAIMTLPMARQLKAGMPQTRLVIVARTNALAEPFRRLEGVDHVDIQPSASAFIRGVRRHKPDLAIVPFPSNRWQYNLMLYASGAKTRLIHGYDIGKYAALGVLPATRVPAVRRVHDVVQNLRLLESLGITINPAEAPTFVLRDDETAEARAKVDQLKLQPGKFVVIHAGAAQSKLGPAKRWPAVNFAALIKAIRRTTDLAVAVIEGPDERGIAEQIIKLAPGDPQVHAVPLGGSLGTSAAFLALSRLYVGSDSGVAHLAAAVGVRTVTLFAPADPDRVCPFGNRDLVVSVRKACSPCALYPFEKCSPAVRCTPPFCIEQIHPDAVMIAVHRGLTKHAG